MVSRFLQKHARGICRYYPLASGRARIANTPLGRSLSAGLGVQQVTLLGGETLLVDCDDFIGRTIFLFGDFEPSMSWACRRVLRAGDVVLDIGANFGLVSMTCAKAVGSSGCVHAFEPQPELADLCERSAALNGMRQVVVHRVGLSDADGEVTLTVPGDNRGAASLEAGGGVGARKIAVAVKEASGFLEGLDLGPVRLMKVDVEGHEPRLFEGARRWIEKVRPSVIVFESKHVALRSLKELEPFRMLSTMDYALFAIRRGRFRFRVVPIDTLIRRKGNVTDYVALSKREDLEQLRGALGVCDQV